MQGGVRMTLTSTPRLYTQDEPFSVGADGFLVPVRPPLTGFPLNGAFVTTNVSAAAQGMPSHWHCCAHWHSGNCAETAASAHKRQCSTEAAGLWKNAAPGARAVRVNMSQPQGAPGSYSTGGLISELFDLGPNPGPQPSYYYFSAQYKLDQHCRGEPPEIVMVGQEGGGAGYELPHFGGVDSDPSAADLWHP
jgi:hypothetical protein